MISGASKVQAAGTPAGTVIANQASATYKAKGGQQMPAISSNVVSVIVAQEAVINVTPSTTSHTTQLNTSVDYPSIVTNSGNGTDVVHLTAVSSLGFATAIYRDVNNDGLLESTELTAGPISQTPTLPADSSTHIIVRVTVPNNPAFNGQTDVLTLTATSTFDPTKQSQGMYSTHVTSAALTFRKSVSNAVPRGGDRVTYTLAYTNAGGGDATSAVITDILDNNLNFVSGSATPTPSSVAGRTIVWNLGTIAANSNGTISFQVDLVSNAVPGTEVHNNADVHFNDGPNPLSITSTESNFITVQGGGGVTIDFTPVQTGAGEPGDTVDYAYTVTNNGIFLETFNFSYVSSQGLVWAFYHDLNGNGRVDAGEPVTTSTGVLAGGGTQYRLVARTIVPVVPADHTVDVTTFRVGSTTNAANFKTTTGTTTISIPVMSLAKVANAPDPKPGREITYTITYGNSGSGRAIQFVVTDPIPPNTTYVAQSVKLNNVPKTDEVDADEVTVSGSLVTVNVGTVMPQASGTIEFRVKIH
jgi:large repetitive protein